MEIKKGIPVSPGVAICSATVITAKDVRIPRKTLPEAELPQEHNRLNDAFALAIGDVENQLEQVTRDLGPEPAKIFSFHLGMLQDDHLKQQAHDVIDDTSSNAEYAVVITFHGLAQHFMAQTSELFQERISDIYDLEKRVLRHLMGDVIESGHRHLDREAIVVAHDLTPSQTANLDRSLLRALTTDLGGRTSHTAIVARSLGIPAVVGLENAAAATTTGDTVIVDGYRGLLIIDPDGPTLEEYYRTLEEYRTIESTRDQLTDLPAVTTDGVDITLTANIEFPDEIPQALRRGATGVGLYRTEYLFLASEQVPDEEEQYNAFKQAAELLDGRPMVIRTLDLGADKYTQAMLAEPEPNPFLGCRSIRLCLQDLPMFKTHLRAILRASVHGPIKIMFPLVTNMMELRQTRMILNDVMEDLEEDGIPFDRDAQVGMMIEVPAAALMSNSFAQEVDFFSIGTNDLVQYTLAVDRGNEKVASLYSSGHPAVLSLIKDVIRAGKRKKIDVSCCGEMAGEPEYAMLLIGMGLRTLSMTPQSIPQIKQLIRSVSIEHCERVARRAASYDSDRQVVNYLRDETKKVIPEVFDGRSVE